MPKKRPRVLNVELMRFFRLQREASRTCGKFKNNGLCNVAVSDMAHKILDKNGYFRQFGTRRGAGFGQGASVPVMQLGILPIEQPNRIIMTTNEFDKTIRTEANKCKRWTRWMGTETPKDVAKLHEDAEDSCQSGIKIFTSILKPHIKHDHRRTPENIRKRFK